jgi:hypothetical protein
LPSSHAPQLSNRSTPMFCVGPRCAAISCHWKQQSFLVHACSQRCLQCVGLGPATSPAPTMASLATRLDCTFRGISLIFVGSYPQQTILLSNGVSGWYCKMCSSGTWSPSCNLAGAHREPHGHNANASAGVVPSPGRCLPEQLCCQLPPFKSARRSRVPLSWLYMLSLGSRGAKIDRSRGYRSAAANWTTSSASRSMPTSRRVKRSVIHVAWPSSKYC